MWVVLLVIIALLTRSWHVFFLIGTSCPSIVEKGLLKDAYKHLKKFNNLLVALQKQGTTLYDVRSFFDHMLTDYPLLGDDYLSSHAKIVANPNFEQAIVNINDGTELNPNEHEDVKGLLNEANG